MDPERVLSIQSHVVSGYVGNKAAVFPLQLLGFDVDVVNSVHFSNHTGFEKGWEGDVLQGDQLRSIMKGLERNGLLNDVGHLLTGYIGSESFLEAVMDVLRTIRTLQQQQQQQQQQTKKEEEGEQQNQSGGGGSSSSSSQPKRKKLRYVCDPVLGDVGSGFYVPQELVRLFRERVIPEADVVTPNQFEAEQLTGMTMSSIDDVKKVCNKFHDMGPKLVLITSVVLNDDNNNDHQNHDDNKEAKKKGKTISIIASSRGEVDVDDDDHNDDKDKLGTTTKTTTAAAVAQNHEDNKEAKKKGKTISIIASSRGEVDVDDDDHNDDKDKLGTTTKATTAAAAAAAARMWRIDCPELPGRYTGTGDLLSALLLGHSAINPTNLPRTLEKVMNTMYACIKRSLDLSPEVPLESKCPRGLMLIQCKDLIENPPQVFKARLIE